MSWFIFIKFDNKIYVLIMSWFIFIKIGIHIYVLIYRLILLFTQYSHKNKTTSTFNKMLHATSC